jgi:hypothetical protein
MNVCRRQVTGVSRQSRRGLWRAGAVRSVQVAAAITIALTSIRPVHAAVFTCPSGSVTCLIAAINTANGNGEANTIALEAGIYSLTAVDNKTDGPNGLPSITSTLTIVGAALEGLERAEQNELPPLPTGMTTVIERHALTSPPPFRLFHVAVDGTLILEGLTLRGGDAFAGGGLFNRGTLTIHDSTLVGNRAKGGGGLVNLGTLIITTSTLVGNSGGNAIGGLFNAGTAVLTNSTVGDNAAPLHGGLFNSDRGSMFITNTTISRNVAASGAGGLLNRGTLTLQNTILARNLSGDSQDCSGTLTSLGNNLLGNSEGCTVTLHPSDRTGNPLLAEFNDVGTPGLGHFPLRPDSPALDAGNDDACPATDQLGRTRVMALEGAQHICDIGASAFQPDLDL